jgi:hypothetical protein
MIVPPEVARHLSLLIEPGRRQMADAVSARPELRAWLAELDVFAPTEYVPPAAPSPVWISTNEAADLLGVSPRQARYMATKLRTQRVGSRLMFDRDDVLDEVDARAASRTSPSGSRSDADIA